MQARSPEAVFEKSACEVRCDPLARQMYATDASIYRIEPVGVAFPRNGEEAADVIRRAADAGLSIIPRGAGTGLAGGALGDGLVVEFARHSRWIRDFDSEKQTVRVGAGVVLDQLNEFLKPHGLCFGPDVATSSRATLGGMIANNSSGARAPLYGTTAEHVVSIEAVLADGRVVTVGNGSANGLGELPESVRETVDPHTATIRERFPSGLTKRWPGYGLDRYLNANHDLTQILTGSEGTLAGILSAELKAVPTPKEKGLGLFFFSSVMEAMEATVAFLDLKPAAIEHIDRVLFDQTRGQLAFRGARSLLRLDEEPCEAVLMVELYDDIDEKLSELAKRKVGLRSQMVKDPTEMAQIWALRKSGLSLLTGRKGPAKPIAGIEDVAVRPEQLPDFVRGLQALMDRLGVEGSFYGHAAAGLLHVRPVIDLHKAEDIRTFRTLSDEVSALTKQFRGSISAEHGVGMARTEYLPEHVGPELLDAMTAIKRLFDPKNVLNPGKVVPTGAYRIDENLRQGAGHDLKLPFEPVLRFADKDGSFVGNLEQCNGCGGCRKDEPTMCPTFIATGDEIMSTRGRANIIRATLEQRFQGYEDPLAAKELTEAISNCLSCKACTPECPSNVNMTLLKAELLHARQRKNGLTLRERLVSSVDVLGKLSCLTPRIANFMVGLPIMRILMDRFVGFAKERPFPAFALQRFDRWFAKRPAPPKGPRGKVYLWDDTFVDFFEPNIGQAAVKVLEAAGYEVALVTGRKCCGRPAFSVGRLDKAKAHGEHNVAAVRALPDDAPILFLEPSCYSMFAQDYRELGVAGIEDVSPRCLLFDDFVLDLLDREPDALRFQSGYTWVAIHAHCHTKAIADPKASERLLKHLPNSTVTYLNTGCCGMAGQFGQLKEKYALSVKVGEDLANKINELPAGTEVVASGTSCRHQIDHMTPVKPLHIAELLAQNLDTES